MSVLPTSTQYPEKIIILKSNKVTYWDHHLIPGLTQILAVNNNGTLSHTPVMTYFELLQVTVQLSEL